MARGEQQDHHRTLHWPHHELIRRAIARSVALPLPPPWRTWRRWRRRPPHAAGVGAWLATRRYDTKQRHKTKDHPTPMLYTRATQALLPSPLQVAALPEQDKRGARGTIELSQDLEGGERKVKEEMSPSRRSCHICYKTWVGANWGE